MKIWDFLKNLIEVQGVLVNEGWGFQSNPKVQEGFSDARVGLSNPTQDSGV
jgi:hypothetical protein